MQLTQPLGLCVHVPSAPRMAQAVGWDSAGPSDVFSPRAGSFPPALLLDLRAGWGSVAELMPFTSTLGILRKPVWQWRPPGTPGQCGLVLGGCKLLACLWPEFHFCIMVWVTVGSSHQLCEPQVFLTST